MANCQDVDPPVLVFHPEEGLGDGDGSGDNAAAVGAGEIGGAGMTQLGKLFEPTKIAAMELKNRIVMSPVVTRTASADGEVTDYTIDYYQARARGGVGLVIVEMATFIYEARAPFRLQFHDDRFIPGFKKLVAAVKPFGAKIALQLNHHGAQSGKLRPEDKILAVAPSPVQFPGMDFVPREMTQEGIGLVIEAWSEAARRAREARFDAVEIHAAHGYLLSQFLSPFTNRRTDTYGGSVENRARFACEVIAATRKKVGQDFPIIVRLNGSDYWEGGITTEDAARQGALFVKAGVDALDVSSGCLYSRQWGFLSYLLPPACNVPSAEAIKKSVNVPVIVVGKLGDPVLANSVLEEGKADLIAMGRPLLVDPDLPNKAREGRFQDIRPCIVCNNCTKHIGKDAATQAKGSRCTVNPGFPKERDFTLKPTASPKKVMVIGGGLAGMEAARVLAQRGHKVSLFEKTNHLGGQWNIAAQLETKKGYAALTSYMVYELDKAGVRVTRNQEVTPELVEQIAPEAIVVAIGAVPRTPDIPGVDRKNVVQAVDVIQGKRQVGDSVVVVGGSYMGLEIADLLARGGKKVIVIEALGRLGADMEVHIYRVLLESLIKNGAQMLTNAKVFEIGDDGVYVEHHGQALYLRADSVVLAVGACPDSRLFEELKRSFNNVYPVGDCVAPRDALEAIREGNEIGRQI